MTTPAITDVDAYKVPSFLAERIAKIHRVPIDFSEGLVREAKRMLYLSIVSDDSVAPSDRVDWAWHEMIMFTMFYRDFSKFIGGFIHHIPNPPPKDVEVNETWDEIQKTIGIARYGSDTYRKTKANYKKYFDINPDPLFWP